MTTSQLPSATFGQGAKDALVIVLTYLPASFAFGVAAVKYGFSAWEALFLSSTIYAGASQFIVIALLGSGSSIWAAALTVIALDLRHLLYGPALVQLMPDQSFQLKKTAFWAWGLTDEVFARGIIQLTQRKQQWSEHWMLGLSFTSWLSWASGSFIGGLFANKVHLLPQFLQAGLDFLLPALFLSFLLAAFNRKQLHIIVAALTVSAVGCIFVGLSFAIFSGILSGMIVALFKHYVMKEPVRES